MKRWHLAILLLFVLLGAIGSWIFLSQVNIAVLNPKGMIAVKQRKLILDATWLMLIVVVPVFFLTAYFTWKYRASNKKAKYTPDWEHQPIAEVFWWGIPFIIIVILAVITWKSSHELSPFKPLPGEKKTLVIQAVALQWKWLFLYPKQGIATVNWVQFPENIPVRFEITADAPMNSFWIPQLGGQIYAMPAMKTELHLIANEKGDFKGLSANISGKGFAGMTFTARASSEEEFEDWISSVKSSDHFLHWDAYLKLVEPSESHPVTFYVLQRAHLFDEILQRYSVPHKE